MGLIGPNGAGKSTFVDAVSGFLPAARQGAARTVSDSGRHVADRAGASGPAPHVPAGPRAPVAEVSRPICASSPGGASCHARRDRRVCSSFGCPGRSLAPVERRRRHPPPRRGRRGWVLSRPRVLVLDEPAAWLSHYLSTSRWASVLRQAPARFGMVAYHPHRARPGSGARLCARRSTVLDFGPRARLRPPGRRAGPTVAVIKAYMGETEMLSGVASTSTDVTVSRGAGPGHLTRQPDAAAGVAVHRGGRSLTASGKTSLIEAYLRCPCSTCERQRPGSTAKSTA